MVDLLKKDFLVVINNARRGDAPEWTDSTSVRYEDIADNTFDIDDSKETTNTIKRPFGQGTASYVNGKPSNTYTLRFICYDEYMHQFVYDDGKGHANKSMLKKNTLTADFIVYDTSEENVWIIIHELSKGILKNKSQHGQVQLERTVDLLCRSKNIKKFVDTFKNKWCVLSAYDKRVIQTPNGIADAFMNSYTILPEPLKFQFGAMKRLGFMGYETSIIVLE